MSSFIQDIVDDPGEYLPMLLLLAGLIVFWVGLCVSGFVSLRTSTRRRKFWFALAPLLFGLIGVWAQIPFSMERDSFQVNLDLGWIFLVPLLLGSAGLVIFWRARQEIARV